MDSKNYFVHESSYVDEPCQIGKGTKIWHFSHIMKNSVIGENCNIGQNVVVSPDVPSLGAEIDCDALVEVIVLISDNLSSIIVKFVLVLSPQVLAFSPVA